MHKINKLQIVITAYKVPGTVRELVTEITKQILRCKRMGCFQEAEIILVAPDAETLKAGMESDKLNLLKVVQDKGEGKPAALNGILKMLDADVVIFTDGDVKWGSDVISPLLDKLFSAPQIGAVTGRPLPINSRQSLFGYWAWLTTQEGAHQTRLKNSLSGKFVNLSGYLFAIKREYLPEKIPHELLAEDVYISYIVYKKGGVVSYAPDALVYVVFPKNFKDWINQKKRAAGGDYQLKGMFDGMASMRSFTKEAKGVLSALLYATSVKELFWSFLLILARLYMWFLIFWEQKIKKKNPRDIWVRIESTKRV